MAFIHLSVPYWARKLEKNSKGNKLVIPEFKKIPKHNHLSHGNHISWKFVNWGHKKKNCYVALIRPTVKCEKTGSFFFFVFFFFWKCQIWAKNLLKFVFNGLKKHLYILTAFRPCFPHLETLKKILENSTLSRYVKKKKKKSTDRPNFQILCMWGQHNKKKFGAWYYDTSLRYSTGGKCWLQNKC